MGAMQSAQVTLGMPPFTAETNAPMTSILTALGLRVAMSDGARFSILKGCADPTTLCAPIAIQQIFAKATIEVQERGTEAAAAAAVVAGFTSAPVVPQTLVIDHPFVYVLHDTVTNTVLFMGTMNNLR